MPKQNLTERHFLTTAQRVMLWKWLEEHGTRNAASVAELYSIVKTEFTAFEFKLSHLRHVVGEMGLTFTSEVKPGTEIQILAQAVKKLYEELGVEPNPAVLRLAKE